MANPNGKAAKFCALRPGMLLARMSLSCAVTMTNFAGRSPWPSTFSTVDPTSTQIIDHLRHANQIAIRAQSFGHHPFGAILVAPDHETVLLAQGNVDGVNHAESVLVRTAATNFGADYLWDCTLYTTVEPCAMCAATQYWANIGRLVYGLSEARLLELTGSHPENPTLNLPCRDVFGRGQKAIAIWGPITEVESEIAAVHEKFWQVSE